VNAIEGKLKRTALHWAAYNGRVDVAMLLLENEADATIKDANGKTALSLSGMSWSKDKSLHREPMIIALIEHDSATAAEDVDLMAIAAIRGSAKVIDKLVDAKAQPSKQDEHGW
jgi:ankyrin repeat protein